MAERTVKRIKLTAVKPYAEAVEVEVPKDMRILDGGWLEGLFQLWVDMPADGETEKVKLRLLEEGAAYDTDEFEILACGIRTNAKPVCLLKAKA